MGFRLDSEVVSCFNEFPMVLFSDRDSQNSKIDVEEHFTKPDVQELLERVTGLDVEGKIFRGRNIDEQQRSQYQLMTDNMLEEVN